jgi:hypothetical protein
MFRGQPARSTADRDRAVFIGDGRPAIRLPPGTTLSDCYRPATVFRMGMCCSMRASPDATDGTNQPDVEPAITRDLIG